MALSYAEAVAPQTTGPGRALDAPVASRVEGLLGRPVGAVAVHTGPQAATAAARAGARAYTAGSHIVFGAGQWQPGSVRGDALIAHELTHVVQQREKGPRVQCRPWDRVGVPDPSGDYDEDELDADLTANHLPWRTTPLPYRQAMRALPPTPRPVPAAAQARRRTPDHTDPAAVRQLLAFLEQAQSRIQAELAAPHPNDSWVSATNQNIIALMRILDQLIAELRLDRLVIAFDQPTTGRVVAAWSVTDNVMHLRPLASTHVSNLAVSMLHEYTHTLQDRTQEDEVARQLRPLEHSRADELDQEVGARLPDAYFTELLRVVRMPVHGHDQTLSAGVFHHEFERARTGGPRVALAQRRLIETQIGEDKEYEALIKRQAPSRNYPIEISTNNHAVLRGGSAGAVDLGAIPAAVNTDHLSFHLVNLLERWSGLPTLFTGPGGTRLSLIYFTVVYNGRPITQGAVLRPASAAP